MSTAQPATVRAAGGGAVAGPVRRHLGLALVLIATAQLMVVLDATIVNVALPDVQRALGFSGTGLEWVVNAYALTFGGLLLLGGRAGDILGRRRMFIAGIVLFSLASVNPVPYFMKYGENAWAGVKGYLDEVTERTAAPVIAKYTGVLAAADIEIFTRTTSFAIMQSLRLDRGPSAPVHP